MLANVQIKTGARERENLGGEEIRMRFRVE
jgi:hypothetical protein